MSASPTVHTPGHPVPASSGHNKPSRAAGYCAAPLAVQHSCTIHISKNLSKVLPFFEQEDRTSQHFVLLRKASHRRKKTQTYFCLAVVSPEPDEVTQEAINTFSQRAPVWTFSSET